MTKSNWYEMTQKWNEEKARLEKIAYTQIGALQLIDKAEKLTGHRMRLIDAISHLATVKVNS